MRFENRVLSNFIFYLRVNKTQWQRYIDKFINMEILLGIIGLVIILLVFGDFFFTTLSFHGYGSMSRRLNKWLGLFIVKHQSSNYYTYSGVSHLLINSVTWLLLLILGTWLMFSAHTSMVINSSTNVPASLLERFYFTCYVISTVGLGDFKPGNELSQIIFSVVSFSGFVMLTLNITYLSSVIQAVKQQKTLALQINNLGKNPQELVLQLKKDQNITNDISAIKSLLSDHIIDHFSFPVILRFISRKDSRCPVIQCIQLYIALIIYENEHNERSDYKKLRNMLEIYLNLDPDVHEELDTSEYSAYKKTEYIPMASQKKINAILKSIGKNWKNIRDKDTQKIS